MNRLSVGEDNVSSDLAELLEFIRGEIADGYGITLTPEEAALLMAEFDRRGGPRS